jgi:hypothetical protein
MAEAGRSAGNNMGKLCLILFLLTGISRAQTPTLTEPPDLTYESITKWHESGGLAGYWRLKEYRFDLNDDKREEVFLAIHGYSRGMIYALFTKSGGKWILLSSEIEGSHTTPHVLPAIHSGWHDFLMIRPSGHGPEINTTYTWNGKKYVEKLPGKIR